MARANVYKEILLWGFQLCLLLDPFQNGLYIFG